MHYYINKNPLILKTGILGIFIIVCVLCSLTGLGQSVVRGVVKSAVSNQPVANISVTIKGTQSGTTTDDRGEFSIAAHQNDVLQFSGIGFQNNSVTIADQSTFLTVSLAQSADELNEVVVTALNITKEKKSLGYSVQSLKSSDLSETKEANLVNALSGKAAGVRVTNSQGDMGSSRIIIRGETSISGNNQPLFVIDGVPVDNTQLLGGTAGGRDPEASRDFSNPIADINPEDIESISILKGPNAAALYGSRAASGVILIQTKTGRGAKGLGVTLNSNTTLSSVLELPKYQNVFGQGSNGQFSYVDGAGGGINDAVDESWGPKMDGRLIPQFFSDGAAVPFVPHPNNVKDFFNTGYQLNNGVSFAGSGDKYNFRFSYENMSQHGIVPNTDQQRNSFLLNAGYNITPNLSINVMGNYIKQGAGNLPGGAGLRETSTMLQFAWFGRQVDMHKLYDLYKEGDPTNWNNLYYSNRYFIAYNNTVGQDRNRLIGNVNLKYKILDGLTAVFQTGNDNYTDRRKMKVAFGTKGAPYGSYGENTYLFNENNTELHLDFTRKISSDFNIDVMGGGNIRTNTTEENVQRAPELAVAGVYTLNNSRDPLISTNYDTKLKTYSLFSSAQIGFRDYAFLNLTARNDWSSSLPVNRLSYFYPSVNGSFILSQALHIENQTINSIKLRGGWSKVGKATSAYQLINSYAFTVPFGTNPQLQAGSIDLNPDLRPESTTSTEGGVELGLFNNRVFADVSLYDMNSSDQILAVDVSPSTGYLQKLVNGGKINNKGVEVELTVRPVQKENFRWDVTINYSTNHSKVINLDRDGLLQSFVLGSDGTLQVIAAPGHPYGSLFGTGYLRDAGGEIVVDNNGLPLTDPNNKFLGKFTPDWLGSIANSFRFHNFHLDFLIDSHNGGSIYSATNSTATYTGVLASTLPGRDEAHGGILYYYPENDNTLPAVELANGSTSAPNGATVHDDGMIFKGVTQDGKTNDVIIPAQSYYKSLADIDEAWVYNASYIKLREVKFGYTLPADFTRSIGFQSATIALVGRNLWIIKKHVPNIDPETAFNTGNGQGIEDLALPTVRSYGININLKF